MPLNAACVLWNQKKKHKTEMHLQIPFFSGSSLRDEKDKKENSKKDIFLVPYNTSHILKTNKEKKEVLLNPIYYNKNEI